MDIVEYRRQYYLKNKDKILARSKLHHSLNKAKKNAQSSAKYYSEDRLPYLLYARARERSRNKNLIFNITKDDIVIPELCPVLGIPLKRAFGGKAKPNSPSLDRINPELGYIKGNIIVMSYKANCMKNNATLEELKKFAEWINNL